MIVRPGTRFNRLIALRSIGHDRAPYAMRLRAMPTFRYRRHRRVEGGHDRAVRLV